VSESCLEPLAWLEKTLDTMQLGVTITDAHGTIVWVNRADAQMHGWKPEELLGQNVRVYAPSDLWAPLAPEKLREVRSLQRESVNVRRDGSRFAVRLLSDRVLGPTGETEGLVTTCEDITERKLSEQALEESRAELAAVIENTADAVVSLDAGGRILVQNSALRKLARALLGAGLETGDPVEDSLPDAVRPEWRNLFRRVLGGERIVLSRTFEVGGNCREFEISWNPVISEGKVQGVSIFGHDDTERHRIERALKASEARYLAARGVIDGQWDWNPSTGTLTLSPRWREMLGAPAETGRGILDDWLGLVHPEDRPALDRDLAAHLAGESPWLENEHRLLHTDGTHRWMLCRGIALRDPSGRPVRLVGTQIDITARKRAEARLVHDSCHDSLTGLPNRRHILEKIRAAAERRHGEDGWAVIFLDIDEFKAMNDRHGHAGGDELLVTIAARLRASVRPGDVVARLGGDEFAILLEGIRGSSEVSRTAERILRAMEAPFVIRGRQVEVSVSMGVASGDSAGDDPDRILGRADAAMYQAKLEGKSRYRFFDASLAAKAAAEEKIVAELPRIIERHDLRLDYQPILSLVSGRIVGLEALVRVRDVAPGWPSTVDFLAVAEQTGAIFEIGAIVLAEACGQITTWRNAIPAAATLPIRLNLTSRQLHQPDLIELLDRALASASLPGSALRLEVREEAILRDFTATRKRLERLRDRGIVVDIDDYGTGDLSAGRLADLPVGGIKIDRSIVAKMETGSDSGVDLARALVAIGHGLGLSVTAEGIETPGQLGRLRQLDCEQGQGFLFARPMQAETAGRLVAEGRPLGMQPSLYRASIEPIFFDLPERGEKPS
jgi:diguanylate cyclase (GGDEF)-like protein/PAS domain S-box-containing protein